jgi:hypothetical protein
MNGRGHLGWGSKNLQLDLGERLMVERGGRVAGRDGY